MKLVLLIPLKLSATSHSDRASLNFYIFSNAVNYSPVWSTHRQTHAHTPSSTHSANGVFSKKGASKKGGFQIDPSVKDSNMPAFDWILLNNHAN